MTPHGTHRIKNAPDSEDGVWVEDSAMGFELSESAYRERDYAPPVDTLPWGTAGGGSTSGLPS